MPFKPLPPVRPPVDTEVRIGTEPEAGRLGERMVSEKMPNIGLVYSDSSTIDVVAPVISPQPLLGCRSEWSADRETLYALRGNGRWNLSADHVVRRHS